MAIFILAMLHSYTLSDSKRSEPCIITKLNLEYTHFKISKFKVRIDHRKAIVVRLRFIFLTQKSESDQTLGSNLYQFDHNVILESGQAHIYIACSLFLSKFRHFFFFFFFERKKYGLILPPSDKHPLGQISVGFETPVNGTKNMGKRS